MENKDYHGFDTGQNTEAKLTEIPSPIELDHSQEYEECSPPILIFLREIISQFSSK